MKSILSLLVIALMSTSAFAQDPKGDGPSNQTIQKFTITNKTYPEKKLEISCLQNDCSLYSFTLNGVTKTVSRERLEEIAKTKLPVQYIGGQLQYHPLSPYEFTKRLWGFKKRPGSTSPLGRTPPREKKPKGYAAQLWKEGREFDAILFGAGRGISKVASIYTIALDTLLLPYTILWRVTHYGKNPADKIFIKMDETVLEHLDSDTAEISIKDQRFQYFQFFFEELK